MSVITKKFKIKTKGFTDILDITPQVEKALKESGLKDGILTVFVPGSTAGITTIEYEPGLLKDLPNILEKIIPSNVDYAHDMAWGDGNGFSHIRSALIKTSFTAPFVNSQMTLGTWQQIVLMDFDNRSRNREIVVQIIGE